MFRNICAILFLISFSLLNSCHQSGSRNEMAIYTVQKENFENRLMATGYLEALNAHYLVCPELYQDVTILKLIKEGTEVKAGDTVCVLDANEIENEYKTALKEKESAELEYTRMSEEMNLQFLLLKSQVSTLEATAQISRLDSAQQAFVSESEKQIIAFEIRKAEIEKEKLQDKLRFLREINEAELVKLKLKIEQAENNVDRSRDMLNRLILTAPAEGIVQYTRNRWTNKKVAEGDITWGGQRILYIPDLSELQARLLVDEASYKRINKGQKVMIKIDASPEYLFSGEIDRKLAAGKPVKRDSPIRVYEIIASLDSINQGILPGLSISCSVLTEHYPDTIVIPLAALFEQDSIKYVYVKQRRKYTRQPVNMVAQSSTEAVISQGLKEEDVISLTRPSQFR